MVDRRQPRWPEGTPVAPSGKGPGGGRFRGDGVSVGGGGDWADALDGRVTSRSRVASASRQQATIARAEQQLSDLKARLSRATETRKRVKKQRVRSAQEIKLAGQIREKQEQIARLKRGGDAPAKKAAPAKRAPAKRASLFSPEGKKTWVGNVEVGDEVQDRNGDWFKVARTKFSPPRMLAYDERDNMIFEVAQDADVMVRRLPAKKAPAKKTATKKAPAKKAPARLPRTAVEVRDMVLGTRDMDPDAAALMLDDKLAHLDTEQVRMLRNDIANGGRLYDTAVARALQQVLDRRAARWADQVAKGLIALADMGGER